MNNLPAIVEFEGMRLSIIDNNGIPWLTAADIARALGYEREDKVSRIFTSHRDEFTQDMAEVIEAPVSGGSGNLRTNKRIFSPRGCHLIAMFSRTPKAKAFRRWVLDVLEGTTRQALPPHRLSQVHREQLRKVLWSQVSRLPQHLRGTAYANAWNDLKARFAVTTYHDIPDAGFPAAVEFVQGMNLATQYGWLIEDENRRRAGSIVILPPDKPRVDIRVSIIASMARLLGVKPSDISSRRAA
ncbi:MAG TPA: hypothetical protein DCW68_06915 [Rhodospirillaceae bacterium]|nr:hypothetical protein [Rhodospirillaceae bacterium]